MSGRYIPHVLLERLHRAVAPNRVVVVHGPRRVGKTTLIRQYMRRHDPDALLVSGENIDVRAYLESQSVAQLRTPVGASRATSGGPTTGRRSTSWRSRAGVSTGRR